MELCSSSQCNRHNPLTTDQVKKAISSLNRGRAADFYGVTAEHFIYGGEELLRVTTDILNSLFRLGQLTDSMKTGVLTPVLKKKGSANDAKKLLRNNNTSYTHKDTGDSLKRNSKASSRKPSE